MSEDTIERLRIYRNISQAHPECEPMQVYPEEVQEILDHISVDTASTLDVFKWVYKRATGKELSDEGCDQMIHDFVHAPKDEPEVQESDREGWTISQKEEIRRLWKVNETQAEIIKELREAIVELIAWDQQPLGMPDDVKEQFQELLENTKL